MVPMYSYTFSLGVVEDFWKSAHRGAMFVEKMWPDANFDYAVEMFQHEQSRWYVYKKLVKLADRLLSSSFYASNLTFVKQNLLQQSDYFKKMAFAEFGGVDKDLNLDDSSRAPLDNGSLRGPTFGSDDD